MANASNFAWGDADWRTMYITARSEIYWIRCNIPGIPVGMPDWIKAEAPA